MKILYISLTAYLIYLIRIKKPYCLVNFFIKNIINFIYILILFKNVLIKNNNFYIFINKSKKKKKSFDSVNDEFPHYKIIYPGIQNKNNIFLQKNINIHLK
jgi:hypothetical protein